MELGGGTVAAPRLAHIITRRQDESPVNLLTQRTSRTDLINYWFLLSASTPPYYDHTLASNVGTSQNLERLPGHWTHISRWILFVDR